MIKADSLAYLSPQGNPVTPDKYLHNYVDIIHTTAAPPFIINHNEVVNGTKRFQGVKQIAETIDNCENTFVIRELSDIERAVSDSSITGVILGLHQVPYDTNKESLQQLKREGVRILGIANSTSENPFGSGFHDNFKQLTREGINLIELMAAEHMILDLSHAGHKTAEDILIYINYTGLVLPTIVSHTGVYERYEGDINDINNKRNLPEDIIAGVLENNGIVGIYSLTFGLSDSDTSLSPMLRLTKHMADTYGSDKVCIGSDSVYQMRVQAEWTEHFKFMKHALAREGNLEPRYPDTPYELNIPNKLQKIGHFLVSAGLSIENTENIIGNTFTSYLRGNL